MNDTRVWRKTVTTLGAAVLALGLIAGTAAADDEADNPAANETNCDAVGGEYYDNEARGKDRVRECTVGEAGEIVEGVEASHPQQDWTVTVQYPGDQTVYRLAPGEGATVTTTEGGGDPVVIACFNHKGNSVPDFEENDNCQPA